MELLKQYSIYLLLGNVLVTILLAGFFLYIKDRDEKVINTQGAMLMQVVDFLNKAIAAQPKQ